MSVPAAPGSVVRLEVDASDVANLVSNHSAQTASVTGWTSEPAASVTVAAYTRASFTGAYLDAGGAPRTVRGRWSAPTSSTAAILSPSFAVTPGAYVGAQANVSRGATAAVSGARQQPAARLAVRYYDAAGTSLATTYGQPLRLTAADWTMQLAELLPVLVPATAATARLLVNFVGYDQLTGAVGDVFAVSSGTVDYYASRLMVVTAATSDAARGVTFTDAPAWQNVLDQGLSVTIERGGDVDGVADNIDAGTLTARLRDQAVNPTRNARIRRGRKVRLTVSGDGGASWAPLFTGTISQVDAAYATSKSDPTAAPLVTITATDAVADLINTPAPYGYSGALGSKVRALMGASPLVLPYSTDTGTASTTKTSLDEQASLWDQLIRARNSLINAKVFVARDGTLHARTINPPAAALFTLSSAAGAPLSFREVDLTFGSTALVNSVTVTRTNTDEPDGTKTYGPYQNQASIASWGLVSADLEVTDGVPLTLATDALSKYGSAAVFPYAVTVDALDPGAWSAGLHLVELYDAARVIVSAETVDRTAYVIGISHNIEPTRWETRLRLRPLDTTVAVTVVNQSGGATAGPLDVLPPAPGILHSRKLSGTQALAGDGSYVLVAWNEQVASDGGITYAAPGAFTVPRAGRYLVAFTARFTHNANGSRYIRLTVNSVTVAQTGDGANVTSTDEGLALTRVLKLGAGDVIRTFAMQSSGASVNLNDASTSTAVDIAWLGL